MKNIKIIEYPYFLHENNIWRKYPREITIYPSTVNEIIEYNNITYNFLIDGDIIFIQNEDVYETKEELLEKLSEKHKI